MTYAVTDQINGYADVEDVYTQYYNVQWGASANNPLDTRIIKDLKIPSAISINGRTYRVISIGVTGEGIDESDNYWSKTHHLVGTVTIPSSVTRIGGDLIFNYCSGLTSIKVDAGGDVLSTDGKTATVAYPSAGKYDARLVLFNLWGSATKELPEYLEISVPEGIDDIYASAPEGALRAYDVQGRPVTQEQMKREPGIYVLQYVQDGRVVRTQKVLRR